jgi:hypothetical protein
MQTVFVPRENDEQVEAFLQSIEDEKKRADCYALLELMVAATGEPAEMWKNGIVGFGTWHYVYESGREGDWFLIGFAPRKRNIVIYFMSGFSGLEHLLEHLGKHTTGKSCLYLKTLDDVDMAVLRELIGQSLTHLQE